MVYLRSLFTEFCEYFNGKLNWSKMKGDLWTQSILKFFEEVAEKEKARPQREYMTIFSDEGSHTAKDELVILQAEDH